MNGCLSARRELWDGVRCRGGGLRVRVIELWAKVGGPKGPRGPGGAGGLHWLDGSKCIEQWATVRAPGGGESGGRRGAPCLHHGTGSRSLVAR